MIALLLYFLALALFASGLLIGRKTSAYSRLGGAAYERRKFRKTLALLFAIAGLLTLLIAILTQTVPHIDS